MDELKLPKWGTFYYVNPDEESDEDEDYDIIYKECNVLQNIPKN